MTTETAYDVVVIGGGLLGAAAARDAAQRGLSTALFAPDDFGASEGQHSRLALGSLGALETLDFTRVREDCRERDILVQTAPQFVQALPCLIPFYSPGLLAQTRLRASLALSDALGFDPLQHFDPALFPFDSFQFDPFQHMHQIRSAADARRHAPGLRADGLTGAARVWEACVGNPARLALATALDARRHGATLHAHMSVEEIVQEPGPPGRVRVTGIVWRDSLTGAAGHASASLVLVADDFDLQKWGLGALPVPLRLLQAVSVRVPTRMEAGDALALPGGEGALCYVVPDASGCVLGPWEAECLGECGPTYATGSEVTALIESVRSFLPDLTPGAVQAAEIRVHASVAPGRELYDPAGDGGRVDGLLTLFGGTLTTARRLAEDAIDLACRKLGRSLSVPPCRTAITPLSPLADTAALSLAAAVEHAVAQEECRTLRDFLTRRAAPSPSEDADLPVVLETMAALLGWDTDRQARELKAWHTVQALPQTFRVL